VPVGSGRPDLGERTCTAGAASEDGVVSVTVNQPSSAPVAGNRARERPVVVWTPPGEKSIDGVLVETNPTLSVEGTQETK
jgi:hypothetical protein